MDWFLKAVCKLGGVLLLILDGCELNTVFTYPSANPEDTENVASLLLLFLFCAACGYDKWVGCIRIKPGG